MTEYTDLNHILYEQELAYDLMPFNNPICKQTYQSLPRIYGNKKLPKKKYLHIQSRLPTKQFYHNPKYSLTPDNARRISKYIYPNYDRYSKLTEEGSERLRMVTEGHESKEESYTKTSISNSHRKFNLKPIMSEVKSFHISDLETSHKVYPITGENSELPRPVSQLQKLMLNKKQMLRSKTDKVDHDKKEPKPINSTKNEKKLRAVSLNNTNPTIKSPNQKIFNRLQGQFQEIQQQNQQQNSEQVHSLNQKLHKNSNSETNSLSQKSAISLSRHVFTEKSDPTMFRNLDKMLNKSRLAHSQYSRTGSVLENGLFRIPQEKQYKQYITNYKSMGENFSLVELLKKSNFKIIRDEKSVYFGQVNEANQRHGFGVLVSDKEIFEGEYHGNLRVVGFERNIDGTYIGGYQNGVRTGEGVFKWNNGEIFKGNWEKGMKNGFGIWKAPQGHYYEGQWLQNRQNGKGIFKHSTSTYKGQFTNFLKSGKGEEFFVNGDKYKGQYRQGKPDGIGRYQWHQGGYYEGEFKQGKREGYGIWIDSEGTRYQGSFLDDNKHGEGIQIYKTGEKYQGLFKDGFKVKGKLYNSKNQEIEIIVK